MKILEIAPPWIDIPPKGYGGTEWVINNLTEGLVKRGHEVTLFATKNSHTSAELKYVFERPLSEQRIPWEASLPALIHYDQALKNSSVYDIIHFHLSSQTDLVMFPYISKITVPHIITMHGHWPYDVFSYMDNQFKKLYAKKLRTVSISKFMESTLPKGFQSAGYVHNALDIDKYQFGNNGGDYFVWIGRIIPDKGLYEAIRAVKKANAKLIFAGVYNEYMKLEREYFETKIRPQIDDEHIIFVGPANLEQKNKLLGEAIAFLNPIQWEEPFGMVMAESMACGTPVISFNRGAAPELIIDQKTGFLVNSIGEMIDAMKKVSQLNRKDCRHHVEQNFNLEKMTLGYEQIFKQEIENFYTTNSLPKDSTVPASHIDY